jgi:hypothetical protein
LFILFSFNFLHNCRSSADFHLLGVQDLTKNTREGEEEDKPPFCGRAVRGAMAEEAVLPFEVLENVKQLNGPVMELELQLRVLLKSCRRQSLSLPLQSPDNTFLLYAGDSFIFSHPPSVSSNNRLFFPLLRSFLRALGKPETSGP